MEIKLMTQGVPCQKKKKKKKKTGKKPFILFAI